MQKPNMIVAATDLLAPRRYCIEGNESSFHIYGLQPDPSVNETLNETFQCETQNISCSLIATR